MATTYLYGLLLENGSKLLQEDNSLIGLESPTYTVTDIPAVYTVVSFHKLTLADKYAVRGPPHLLTESLDYELVGQTNKAKSLTYTVKTTTSITKSLSYEVTSAVDKTKSLKYTTITTHTVENGGFLLLENGGYLLQETGDKLIIEGGPQLEYRIRQPFSVTKSLLYIINLGQTFTLNLTYAVQTENSIVKNLDYRIVLTFSKTKILLYMVAVTIDITKNLTYVVKSFVRPTILAADRLKPKVSASNPRPKTSTNKQT